MKRLVLLFIAFCTIPVLLSFSAVRLKKSLFNGVWQFTEGTFNGGSKGRPINTEIKIFNNGKFDGFLMSPMGSVKTMSGNFKILNDSVYTERLVKASNPAMLGKTYVIHYKLEGNVMTASGSYDAVNNGITVKVNYRQIWNRIDYPDAQQ